MRKIVGFLIVTFLMLALLSVVASAETTVDLLAGQDIIVGEVSVWNDAEYLYVKYEITGEALTAGWVITETHLAVDELLGEIPQTKKGNPIPGHFPYSTEHDLAVTEFTYEIPLTWLVGTNLCIAAHAVVQMQNGDGIQEETGWGDGFDFPGANWATYFKYIQETGGGSTSLF